VYSALFWTNERRKRKFYKICPGTDTLTGVIKQTLLFKTFPFIPCKQPISTFSVTGDQFDADGSLTALLTDSTGCIWLKSDKAELLCCASVLFDNNIGIASVAYRRVFGVFKPPTSRRNSEDIGAVLDRMSKKNRRLDFLLQFTVFSYGCNLLNKGFF